MTNLDANNLNPSQGFYLYSNIDNTYAGQSVSGAGDVNRDGYSDFIIQTYSIYYTNIGKAYVVYGGVNLNNIDLNSLQPTQGFSIDNIHIAANGGNPIYVVSDAGDMNGDGYDDVIVGAPGVNSYAGAAYVIYGSANPKNIDVDATFSGFTITGFDSGSQTGWAVSSAGDINKDGYDDVIIAAPRANSYDGKVYIIYGNSLSSNISLAELTSSQGFIITEFPETSEGGFSVSSAGDVNGDGYDDVIIGTEKGGYTYVIYGGSNISSTVDVSNLGNQGITITGNVNYNFGQSVSGAGDFNGDGYDDLVISAFAMGISYVIYGGPNLLNIDTMNLEQSQGFSIIGNTASHGVVSNAGDINKDSYGDLLISVIVSNVYISYVIYGSNSINDNIEITNLSNSQGYTITGPKGAQVFETSASNAGDVNKDGFDDIIIGAPASYDFSGGEAYVIYGSTSGFVTSAPTSIPTKVPTNFPTSIPTKAPTAIPTKVPTNFPTAIPTKVPTTPVPTNTPAPTGPSLNMQNVDLSLLSSSQGFYIYGDFSYANAGLSVSGAGDVNGDGYDDVIILMRINNNIDNANAYIIFGGQNMNNLDLTNLSLSQGFSIGVLLSENADWGPYYVSGAGDVNGDGYDDVIVGAPGVNSYAGAAYVIYGSANPKNIDVDATFSGFEIIGILNDVSYTGWAVSEAGDVNGDGYNDVIVGAYNANARSAGEAYVIYGGYSVGNINLDSLTSSQGFMITDFAERSNGGFSVSSAGDVNGDGYDDVIVGAFNPDSSIGEAYVIYGGNSISPIDISNLSSAQGFVITSSNSNNLFIGGSVAGAGNFNGDEYSDIIIASTKGGACVVYGSSSSVTVDLASLSSSQGVYITGPIGYEGMANVNSVGDINNDGYDDVIIGLPHFNSDQGKSYVVYGSSSPDDINLNTLLSSQGFSAYGSPDSLSGYSVSGAGDFNADGYRDLIIGAPVSNEYASQGGQVYVLYGDDFNDDDSSSNSNNDMWIYTGIAAGGAVLFGLAGYGIYAYTHGSCSFFSDPLAKSADVEFS